MHSTHAVRSIAEKTTNKGLEREGGSGATASGRSAAPPGRQERIQAGKDDGQGYVHTHTQVHMYPAQNHPVRAADTFMAVLRLQHKRSAELTEHLSILRRQVTKRRDTSARHSTGRFVLLVFRKRSSNINKPSTTSPLSRACVIYVSNHLLVCRFMDEVCGCVLASEGNSSGADPIPRSRLNGLEMPTAAVKKMSHGVQVSSFKIHRCSPHSSKGKVLGTNPHTMFCRCRMGDLSRRQANDGCSLGPLEMAAAARRRAIHEKDECVRLLTCHERCGI